jgi:hypothetical protein
MAKVDWFSEQVLRLKQARSHFASKPSYNTLKAWVKKGVYSRRGVHVRLESFREGGRVYTSIEATQRFRERLND